MALKRMLQRLTAPVAELDEERLREFCTNRPDVTPIAEVVPRAEATVVGEISSVRIVPRDGSPWLEATVTDGTASLTALWTGRRRIAGIVPGKRLVLAGRAIAPRSGARLQLYNPTYELL